MRSRPFLFSPRVDALSPEPYHRLAGSVEARPIYDPLLQEIADLRTQLSELSDWKAEQEAAAADRNRLFAMLSHDLRASLGGVMLYHDVLLSGAEGPLNDSQAEGITLAQKSIQHLSDLATDLLDLSRTEASRIAIQPQPVEVAGLVAEVVATLRPLAAEHGSELRIEHCGRCTALTTDPCRVRQILLNLLSNAIKFGEGEPITTTCRRSETGEVVIEVEDRGCGIAEEELPRIFDEFVQLRGAERQGTGLGLAVAKRLASLLGGKLEARSAPGQGSTFRLTLPELAPAE